MKSECTNCFWQRPGHPERCDSLNGCNPTYEPGYVPTGQLWPAVLAVSILAVLFVFFVIFAMVTRKATAEEIGKDKYYHAAGSAVISMASNEILETLRSEWSPIKKALVSIGVAMATGAIKEAVDPVFDKDDLAADAIGAIGGILIIFEW